ncbi:MAG: heparinase II/III family protein [candidate division WOR-3 bacterium]
MEPIPINEAEAIIEAFWDQNLSNLKEYKVTLEKSSRAFVRQTWCSAEIYIERATLGKTAVSLERQCDIHLDEYDIIRVFAAIPRWVRMTLKLHVDESDCTVIDGAVGDGSVNEYDGYVTGKHVTGIRIDFALSKMQPANIQIYWIGLAKKEVQEKMERRKSPYTPDWPKMLRDNPSRLEPKIGIFFDEEDLILLRQKVKSGYLKRVFDNLRLQCIRDMSINPEAEIGRFIPWGDRRWCRNRDMKRTNIADAMERLAFVGLIDENSEMLRMAARMALSAAHSEYWCESFMGVFPGSTWHHRSFTETKYSYACALVLDWAGSYLTPYGEEVIRDAIIIKGLPRIESDFKRMEYIREMNQGVLFSLGRIIGALSLLPAYPRYKSLLEEAERDLHEIIRKYIQEDGGTLEGMAYWNATFSTAMRLFYALSKYHNTTFEEYVKSLPKLIKTGDYALSMLSIVKGGVTYLPINDAKSDQIFDPGLVAAYCRISDRSEWKELYTLIMRTERFMSDPFHLIIAPSEIPVKYSVKNVVKPRFSVFPRTGQFCSIRKDSLLGYVHFHFCSGPTCPYHYHEDKGSFILEVNDESLIIDRGVTSYDHPETTLISASSRHNLLCPKDLNGSFLRQPHYSIGGRITSAFESNGAIFLCSDNTDAWNKSVFKRNIRRVFSPTPDLYLIDDVAELNEPHVMVFLSNSPCPIGIKGDGCWIYGEKTSVEIIPVDWVPHEKKAVEYGVDCHLRPVNVLQMETKMADFHTLLTSLQIVPSNSYLENLWQFKRENSSIVAVKGDYEIHLSREGLNLIVTMKKGEKNLLEATCQDSDWIVHSYS